MEKRRENLTTSITLHLNAIVVTDVLMSITGVFHNEYKYKYTDTQFLK